MNFSFFFPPSTTNISAKRNELNTLPDNGRKKQQINVKDNFWPVTGRSKGVLDMWFRDLAGTKPLANLAKKAPSFNKKEDIFTYLCDHQVSMKKAMWFLKLSAAYTTTVAEQKTKSKRQIQDPSGEWTQTVTRVMKDLSQKLIEHYALEKNPKVISTQQAAITSGPSSSSSLSPPSTSNAKCNRCSIDKQLTPTKCTKDKNAVINKDKSAMVDGKSMTKVKSLREKVLNRSLMKDIRFREMKLTKRKASMLGPPPAKRAKQTLRVARMKAASRIKRESALSQQQQQQPGTSDGSTNPDLAANSTDIPGVASTTKSEDANSVEAKDRIGFKVMRKRLAMKKRHGLPSISQIIADILVKRAKKRAKQRLNEKSAENLNQPSNQLDDSDQKNNTSQASSSPSTSTTNTISPANRPNQSSSKTLLSGKQNALQSQQHTNVESPTTGTANFSNFSSTGRETPNVSVTSTSSNSSSSSSSSSSSNHTFITPAVPTTPGSTNPVEDFATILRHWKYCSRLCRAMCEENLLDRHEFLQWALELLDRMRNKSNDDGVLKLFLPFILQCLPFIVESERLSRRLAYLVCKKIGFMLHYVTEEDGIAVNIKKPPPPPPPPASSTSCCDANITNRLDAGLKIKQEPEIRAPLPTRSAARYKKVNKMDPPTPPPLSTPPSPSTALLDSPEDMLSPKSLLGSNYLPGRPNTNQDRKSFGARPHSASSTSPASKQLSSSQTPPTASPPTASPPSVSSIASSNMPIGPGAVQPVSQNISAKSQSHGLIKHRQKPPTQFMETMLRDFLLCEHHRPVIMELSAMIQAITLRCPGALVWCGISGKERDSITALSGGPLEYMPVLPSQLPMPSYNRRQNDMIRKRLREVEQQIFERSKHSEKRWVADKWLRKTVDGQINEVILNTLSILDAHCFDRLDGNNNNLASLYTKLFQPIEKVINQVSYEQFRSYEADFFSS